MFEFDDIETNERFKKINEDLIKKASQMSFLDWEKQFK
jgi:hypothetical protein